jgi:hypothetical protein
MFMKITNPDSGVSRIAGPGLNQSQPHTHFLNNIADETLASQFEAAMNYAYVLGKSDRSAEIRQLLEDGD